MRKDQTYAPMMTALAGALDGLGPEAPAAHRVGLMREFLTFVDAEMDDVAQRWLAHRRTIEPTSVGPDVAR